MKNKGLWSFLMVLVMVFASLLSTNGLIKAESGVKLLKVNQTVLEFKEIVYVDGTNGDDTIGNGSKEKPYATVAKGFDYMSENCKVGGAVVIADGEYDINNLFNSSAIISKYTDLRISILAETMGKVRLKSAVYHLESVPNDTMQLFFYGIIMECTSSTYSHLGGDVLANEYYNCVLPSNYGGDTGAYKDASIVVENCLFQGGVNYTYTDRPLKGILKNSASTNQYMDPYAGSKENVLYNVTLDDEYNITSDGWQNTGTGTNPDGTQAHIGVYGGQFAWGSKVVERSSNQLDMVLEVDEKLLLSVDNHLSENINMTWSSSDESVVTVDSNGIVTALKAGEATITAKAKNGKYTDTINILVVDDADDYRLAVDLKVGESCRATIDKNKHTANVTWTAADEAVATVSSKGKITAQNKGLTIVKAIDENGQEIGLVYVRVR